MTEKANLCASIATTIQSYRQGEIGEPTAASVEIWSSQFSQENEIPFLREFDHVMKQTFIKKAWMEGYLENLAHNQELSGVNPAAFWRTVNFLKIQKAGQSQKAMLSLFDTCLHKQYGLHLDQCGTPDGAFVYLDDVLFTGGRIATDLKVWIESTAPVGAVVHVILIALHKSGHWYLTNNRLKDAVVAKNIKLTFWCAKELENRLYGINSSDVLWPTSIPAESTIQNYIASIGVVQVKLRQPGGTGSIFSSDAGRQVLEQEFMIAGAKIRAMSHPKDFYRPLGCGNFGVGFGSTIVTYRNCPNNTPLAMWWGDGSKQANALSWHPLFPRKTYASPENIFNAL